MIHRSLSSAADIERKLLQEEDDGELAKQQQGAVAGDQRPQLARSKGFSYRTEVLAVTAVLSSLVFAVWVYNGVFLHRFLPARGKEQYMLPFGIAFNVAWFLLFWSWIQAHTADPGFVPDHWRDFVLDQGQSLTAQPAMRLWQPGVITNCDHCHMTRPERTHHCSTCGVCVLRLDHHCPFVMNCVGFGTLKHFMLLLLYGILTSLIGLCTIAPELAELTSRLLLHLIDGTPWDATGFASVAEAVQVVVFGLLALFTILVLTPLAAFYPMLACTNRTKVEARYDNMPNPYDLGSSTRNLTQVFGEPGIDWLFPVKPTNPVSDGVAYSAPGDPDDPNRPVNRVDFENTRDAQDRWEYRYVLSHMPLPTVNPDKRKKPLSCAPTIGSAALCLSHG